MPGTVTFSRQCILNCTINSEAKWNDAVAKVGDEQATAVQALFESTRKGDFAQILAEKIGEGAAFIVPPYIEAAIEALVK